VRPVLRLCASVVGSCLALFGALGSPARATDAGENALHRTQVVVRVGPTETITVGELEDRIAAMPGFQRATFGPNDTLRSRFVNDVVVPQVLVLLGSANEGLERRLSVSYALDRARSGATIRALRERLAPASEIPMSDVQAYFDENRATYERVERHQIWRILCRTADEAKTVLDEAEKDPTPKRFEALAREHSIDKATNLRRGDVGFVAEDGSSSEPGLRVDLAVVKAAQGVSDGSFVPEPVAEGDGFAVVWRRGTLPSSKRPVQEVAAQIRDTLRKAQLKKDTDGLLAGLRASKVRDVNESLLDTL
jgi:peptidyl-prolyl cis-trans isomerase C